MGIFIIFRIFIIFIISEFVPGEAIEGGRARGPKFLMFSWIFWMESAALGSSAAVFWRFLVSPFYGCTKLNISHFSTVSGALVQDTKGAQKFSTQHTHTLTNTQSHTPGVPPNPSCPAKGSVTSLLSMGLCVCKRAGETERECLCVYCVCTLCVCVCVFVCACVCVCV